MPVAGGAGAGLDGAGLVEHAAHIGVELGDH